MVDFDWGVVADILGLASSICGSGFGFGGGFGCCNMVFCIWVCFELWSLCGGGCWLVVAGYDGGC